MNTQYLRDLLILLAEIAGVLSALSMIMGGQVTFVNASIVIMAWVMMITLYREMQNP